MDGARSRPKRDHAAPFSLPASRAFPVDIRYALGNLRRELCASRCQKLCPATGSALQISAVLDLLAGYLYVTNRSAHSHNLFTDTPEKILNVRVPLLKDLQQCSADLRGQPFEIKALQDDAQVFVITYLEIAACCQVSRYRM